MKDKKRVLLFGSTGQDGSYLAEQLLEDGCVVYGVARRTSTSNAARISGILANEYFHLLTGDITDYSSVQAAFREAKPDWVFNLAAQSHVWSSFNLACTSLDITAQGCVNILEVLRHDFPKAKMYQASSSEMYGDSFSVKTETDDSRIHWSAPQAVGLPPRYQDENTKFNPQSPYAIAKLAAHQFCNLYRKAYGLDIRCGILFNHESERRGEEFVTRKITKWIGAYRAWADTEFFTIGKLNVPDDKIYNGRPVNDDRPELFPKLRLGNLKAIRDWGHAEDYVKAMILIMEHDKADDWVVSTGQAHSVADFLAEAFEQAGLGASMHYIVHDKTFERPSEVPFLKGDSSKIRNELGWEPEIEFKDIVARMVQNDIVRAEHGPK
jgi:GDPmannose 4,6-dehydratase